MTGQACSLPGKVEDAEMQSMLRILGCLLHVVRLYIADTLVAGVKEDTNLYKCMQMYMGLAL